ncbi:MAG: hypothetical protein VX185_10995 [Pseudomonadota bacterium]|nr:hypothetical protein [Pseudomonadota bacterium]
MNFKKIYWCFIFLLCIAQSLIAAPTTPDFLKPWEQWLHTQHPEWQCMDTSNCVWPGYLQISLQEKQGEFQLWVSLESQGEVVLPGKDNLWPAGVMIESKNQSPKALTLGRSSKGEPTAKLEAGHYKISGRFVWDELPESLPADESIAFIAVALSPRLADKYSWRRVNNKILLSAASHTVSKVDNTEEIAIYRQLSQGYPQYLNTWVRLKISGESRTLYLPSIEWPGTEKVSFNSQLPVAFKSNGGYSVQVRQGEHWLRLRSRFTQSTDEIQPLMQRDQLPNVEYWAIDRDMQNTVRIKGVAVDAVQVEMPTAWQNMPSYKVTDQQGLTMNFSEVHQSESKPSLTLNRQLWLNFSGDHLSAEDTISGTMAAPWRLNLSPQGELQRAQSDEALLITQQNGADGVEVREQALHLNAISLWPQTGEISKTGWQLPFETVTATLNVPPGWRLLATSEKGSNAWISKWQLWDIFVLLFAIVITYKTLGLVPSIATALFAIVFYQSYPELAFIWIGLMIVVKLSQELKERLQVLSLGCVAVLAFIFLINIAQVSMIEIRQSIYPQLEHVNKQESKHYAESSVDMLQDSQMQHRSMPAPMALESVSYMASPRLKEAPLEQYGENDFIQTGVGLPEWQWRQYRLFSASNVTEDESLKLYLLTPLMTALLSMLALLGLYTSLYLAWRSALKDIFRNISLKPLKGSPEVATVLIFGVLSLAMPHSDAFAATPLTDQQLENLKSDMQSKTRCTESCFSFNQGEWQMTQEQLDISLALDVVQDTFIPVLQSENWVPQVITLDGVDARAQLRKVKNDVYLRVTAGHHQLTMSGELDQADLMKFVLPDPLHHLNVNLDGWRLERPSEASTYVSSMSFERIQQPATAQGGADTVDEMQQKSLRAPVFVQVTRRLDLGVRWRVQTEVRRIAPETNAFRVEIPLIEGEKPRTSIKSKDGVALIEFQQGEGLVRWSSELSPTAALKLQAGQGQHYYEIWQVAAGRLWQVESNGLAPEPNGLPEKMWKPKPGEQVQLNFTRPEGKVAASQSIESLKLQGIEGESKNTYHLSIMLKAASPGEYSLELPENAELDQVRLNGQRLYDAQGQSVLVSLMSGQSTLEVDWFAPSEDGFSQTMPQIQSSLPLVNINLEMKPLQSRWVLHAQGPLLGPAVLYWGILTTLLLGALVLVVVQRRLSFKLPVKVSDWFLIGVGTSTLFYFSLIPFALWAFVFGWWQHRMSEDRPMAPSRFRGIQVAVIALTLLTGFVLVMVIPVGLLSTPDMQISGYQSSAHVLRWYSDYAPQGQTPSAGYIALPQWVFSGLMLLWSLWLASRLVSWFFMAIKLLQQKPVLIEPQKPEPKGEK